jgi:hypothetical protein
LIVVAAKVGFSALKIPPKKNKKDVFLLLFCLISFKIKFLIGGFVGRDFAKHIIKMRSLIFFVLFCSEGVLISFYRGVLYLLYFTLSCVYG